MYGFKSSILAMNVRFTWFTVDMSSHARQLDCSYKSCIGWYQCQTHPELFQAGSDRFEARSKSWFENMNILHIFAVHTTNHLGISLSNLSKSAPDPPQPQ